MGDPIRGGSGVTITENPCLNCHGAPETQAASEQNLPYAQRRPPHSSPFNFHSTECSAEFSWPPELAQPQSPLFTLPFWVRSNFEKTLQAQRKRDGMAALPFRIDVGQATVEMYLQPRSFIIKTCVPLEFLAEPGAKIQSKWQVAGNQLEIGVRNLLEVAGIEASGPWWAGGITPGKIFRNNKGEIRSSNEMERLGEAWDVLQGWFVDGGSLEDKTLNHFIPEEFKDPKTGAVPEKFQLEDLLLRVFGFLQRQKPTKKKSFELYDLLSLKFLQPFSPNFLQPSSYLRIDIDELKDFFVPGVLDLGPSKGELILQVDRLHNLNLTLEDPDIRLEAMDYPLSPFGDREGLHLKAGRIQAGEPVEVAHQGIIRPGVHLVRSTPTGNIDLEANLKIELELEDGSKLSAQALLKGTLLDLGKANGYQAAPNFYFALQDFNYSNKKGEALLKNSKVEINSIFYPIEWPERPFTLFLGSGAKIDIDLQWEKGKRLKVQGFTPVMTNEMGGVEWWNLWRNLDLMSQIDFLSPKEVRDKEGKKKIVETHYRTDLRVFADAARQATQAGEDVFPFAVEAEMSAQEVGMKQIVKMLEGFHGHVELFVGQDKQYRAALDLKADALNFPSVTKKGLFFKDPTIQIQIDRAQFTKELRTMTFPQWNLSVALKPKRGALQGAASIRQKEGVPFTVQWRPLEKQWMVDGLDWKVQLEKISFDPKVLNLPFSQTQSVSADARLQVDFLLNMQGPRKDWNGEGKILVLGDDDGEVYRVNSRGGRVGPPLIRKTYWLWEKIRRFDATGGYPIGDGKLVFFTNIGSFSSDDGHMAELLQGAGFGPEWTADLAQSAETARSWEANENRWELVYKNQPLTPGGFLHGEGKYVQDLYRLLHPKGNGTGEGGSP